MADPLLSVEALSIAFATRDGPLPVVRDLTFAIDEAQTVGLVGESGSGKTSVALAILNYLPRGGCVIAGDIRYRDRSLLGLSAGERQSLYGRRIAHVAQDPASALNPALRIGVQLVEGMIRHLALSAQDARRRALDLLDEVHLAGGERILDAYPHMLSGGMQQRICIAMTLACDPELIVMDEPTTGLDAATEMAIFDLLRELKARRRLSLLFISHNLAAVRGMADRVVIMYGGRCMESGPTLAVFDKPLHRYTQLMLNTLPAMHGPRETRVEMPWQASRMPADGCPFRDRCDSVVAACSQVPTSVDADRGRTTACVRWRDLPPLPPAPLQAIDAANAPVTRSDQAALTVNGLTHRYAAGLLKRGLRSGRLSLDNVSFELRKGEVLAVIGESGSGKTTLARCIVGLVHPTSGSITAGDADLARLRRYPRSIARNLQIVFQNIAGSLHPRKAVRAILQRPFVLYERRRAADDELEALAHAVGLRTEILPRLSARLSGGERQRAALARAFAPKPAVIVLDEAFSALDVSMKMKVRNLLLRKKAELDASYLLISHDLPLVRAMADRVLVLYQGWLCESGQRRIIESPPFHPYTETLVWAALELESLSPARLKRAGAPAGAATETSVGCRFHLRCPRKIGAICERESPPVQVVAGDHTLACHIPIARLIALQREEFMQISALEGAT